MFEDDKQEDNIYEMEQAPVPDSIKKMIDNLRTTSSVGAAHKSGRREPKRETLADLLRDEAY